MRWWRRGPWRGPPCRPFTIGDGMILVAGIATLLVAVRERWSELPATSWFVAVDDTAGVALMLASCLLLIFRLRGPRPSLRRLARQPGAVACFAVVVFGLASKVDTLIFNAIDRNGEFPRSLGGWIWSFSEPSNWQHAQHAFIVPICWILLIVGRRWRSERGWIDLVGRVLGWSWIAWAISYSYLP